MGLPRDERKARQGEKNNAEDSATSRTIMAHILEYIILLLYFSIIQQQDSYH